MNSFSTRYSTSLSSQVRLPPKMGKTVALSSALTLRKDSSPSVLTRMVCSAVLASQEPRVHPFLPAVSSDLNQIQRARVSN